MTAAPAAATAPMKTLPFISLSLRGSIASPATGDPPDETRVPQGPDETRAAVAVDSPDEAARRHVEEIVRDHAVRPDETRAGEPVGPDETGGRGRSGIPRDVVP